MKKTLLLFVLLASSIAFAQTPWIPVSTPTVPHFVDITWSASASTGIDHYIVYRGANALVMSPVGVTAGTQYVDVGVTGSSTYIYAVSAVSSNGLESALSATISVTIPADLAKPATATAPAAVSTK